MAEGADIEVAQKLAEAGADPSKMFPMELLEIAEAVLLALIAVSTAWSGYQAARWDGQQALRYGTSARLRVEAAVSATEGGQQRLLDVVTFNAWIEANETKQEELAALYRRRFSPEYRVAFDAWLKTEPFRTLGAVPHPSLMPEYHNALLDKSAELNKEATTAFSEGTEARGISERYVRSTVLLATVLFLVAIAQRFKVRKVRMGLLLAAVTLLICVLVNVATYPRL